MEIERPKLIITILSGVIVLGILAFSFVALAIQRDIDEKNRIIELQQVKVEKLSEQVNLLTKVSWIGILQHQIENSVRSNHFVVRKITFGGDTFTGKLSATLELDSGNSMPGKLRATNNFDMTDQELLQELNHILVATSELYDNFKAENTDFPLWPTGNYTIKIDDAVIASYVNGELTLVRG
ncbi:hypothetical protein ACFFK0_12270 [Paenibacillus chartarius]|uniref:Uncharacterized protein n=1 Tax=Paenibacillus chartarius TaxID=747481 RepID=A0ABV6DKN8_9BACL